MACRTQIMHSYALVFLETTVMEAELFSRLHTDGVRVRERLLRYTPS
jgi:hypothetical protein